MERIGITDIAGIRIGQVQNAQAATGVTVIIAPEGMAAGVDVRGGGPASRDSRTLDPLAAAQYIHAIVLAGGSAYGLGTANGVMKYLEERGIGYDTGVALVPLVVQSNLKRPLSVTVPAKRAVAALSETAIPVSMAISVTSPAQLS